MDILGKIFIVAKKSTYASPTSGHFGVLSSRKAMSGSALSRLAVSVSKSCANAVLSDWLVPCKSPCVANSSSKSFMPLGVTCCINSCSHAAMVCSLSSRFEVFARAIHFGTCYVYIFLYIHKIE